MNRLLFIIIIKVIKSTFFTGNIVQFPRIILVETCTFSAYNVILMFWRKFPILKNRVQGETISQKMEKILYRCIVNLLCRLIKRGSENGPDLPYCYAESLKGNLRNAITWNMYHDCQTNSNLCRNCLNIQNEFENRSTGIEKQ